MKTKITFIVIFFSLASIGFGQVKPVIHITYSKWLATYDFVQKLSDHYPDNKFKRVFLSSKYHTQYYTDLISQLDTLNIYESYEFQGYPTGQKIPFISISLIDRNLINAASIQEFKKSTFGIIPNAELFAFSNILSEFEPVYDTLIYLPDKKEIEQQLEELKNYVQQSDLSGFFQKGLSFYGTQWDESIPIDIAVIPSIRGQSFTAHAFLNNAISEIPLHYGHNAVLFSVLMHEIYHNIYDGQSRQLKLQIQSWFNDNSFRMGQYAYLLLNEALATALGNGYVYEQLKGKTDSDDWYNNKYINLMAKKIYPIVKEYLEHNKQIDKDFVDKYIAAYDQNFPGWINEPEHLFAYRYMIADNTDVLDYFRKNYPHAGIYESQIPITQSGLEQMRETPITKIIMIASDNENKLALVKNIFPELKHWQYDPQHEFIHTEFLKDKTWLIIVNKHSTTLDELFRRNFKNKRIE